VERETAPVDRISTPGIDVGMTLGPLAMLAGDPTTRLGRGVFERGTTTPEGPAAVRITWATGQGSVTVEVFGEGGTWLRERIPALVGMADDPSGFQPEHPAIHRLWRMFHGDRVGRTNTLWHDLAWTIVQQRVRRSEAARQWRALVEVYGEAAPGIDELRLPPDPGRLARTSPLDLRSVGLDAQRARTLTNAAVVASRLQRFVDAPIAKARPALSSIPGVGEWTISCLSAFTWGDPDTVIVGDSGIPSMIASAVTGERRADDARMLEILEPFRPHRYRVLRLAFAARTRRT
jgi:3-methyladenine DNA glycosylase/8-oxoguanine DNA glycosylase